MMLRLAAIDIGSNAARLLISEVTQQSGKPASFNKITLLRIPLRLGFDVFDTGYISEYKTGLLLHTMQAYAHLVKAFEIEHIKVCATSAMRDAANTKELVERIQSETGLRIQVITGSEEASILFENHIAETLAKDRSYLYIDVGGGSTETTFFSNGEIRFKESFDIGTIRLLKGKVPDSAWNEMKQKLKQIAKANKNVTAIGSGGNINKVQSLSRIKDGKPLPLSMLRDFYKELQNVSLQDRISVYKLRADRADVIVPALQIYIQAMQWSGAGEIVVPRIGLADGLIQQLWKETLDTTMAAG